MRLLICDQDATTRARLRSTLGRLDGVKAVEEFATMAEIMDLPSAEDEPLVVLVATSAAGRGQIQRFVQSRPDIPVIAMGGNDPDRMRSAFGEGARAYVRRAEAREELMDALGIVARGGVYVPPVIGMRAGGEPLMTTAGPVPAGFFREDAGEQMTPRQREILGMIRAGRNNAQIAEALGLQVGTVKIHVTAVFKALGVRNRTQAMVAADWLDLPMKSQKTH